MHPNVARSPRAEEYEAKAAAAWLVSTRRLYLQLARNYRELAVLRAGRRKAPEISRVTISGLLVATVTSRRSRD